MLVPIILTHIMVVVLMVIIIIAIVCSKGKGCEESEDFVDGKCVNKCTPA